MGLRDFVVGLCNFVIELVVGFHDLIVEFPVRPIDFVAEFLVGLRDFVVGLRDFVVGLCDFVAEGCVGFAQHRGQTINPAALPENSHAPKGNEGHYRGSQCADDGDFKCVVHFSPAVSSLHAIIHFTPLSGGASGAVNGRLPPSCPCKLSLKLTHWRQSRRGRIIPGSVSYQVVQAQTFTAGQAGARATLPDSGLRRNDE